MASGAVSRPINDVWNYTEKFLDDTDSEAEDSDEESMSDGFELVCRPLSDGEVG